MSASCKLQQVHWQRQGDWLALGDARGIGGATKSDCQVGERHLTYQGLCATSAHDQP